MTFSASPINPNQPIPNTPFYYPQQNSLSGPTGPLIVGSGLYIDNETGVISSTGSGGGGVTALISGDGIFLSANTGTVTVSNTGVLNLVAGAGIGVVKVGGTYTITNTSPGSLPTGTVTQVNTGAGLTGGPITSSGTISLTPTGVAAATYTNPTITVDEYGRISFATPGSGGGGFAVQATFPLVSDGLLPSTIGIIPASTTSCGAVQLNDTVTSTSSTQAATARVAKYAHDVASSACSIAVTAIGLATTANNNACNALAIATSAQLCASQALTQAVIAQSTANNAESCAVAAAGTANTALTTANTAQSCANVALTSSQIRIPCSAFAGKSQILVGTGSSSFTTVTAGLDGSVLTACSACPSGVKWAEGGSVGCVGTGTGLTGGPITSAGVIALANTTVVPGSYQAGNFTVNAQGQITAASSSNTIISVTGTSPVCITGTCCINISVACATASAPGIVCLYNGVNCDSSLLALTAQQGQILNDKITALCTGKVSTVTACSPLSATAGINPAISISDASLISKGAVQLFNGTNSTSTSLALTAAQGKSLQDQINSLTIASNLVFAGTFDASTSQILSTSTAGSSAGLSVGFNLPTPTAGLLNYFVIVTIAGTYTPPGGSETYVTSQGDWLMVGETTPGPSYKWQYLNTGIDIPLASTNDAGIVELATTAETQTGTSTTLAITPAGSAATYVQCSIYSAKGALLGASGASIPVALPVGANGLVLTACSTCPTGFDWIATPAAPTNFIPCSVITATGDLVVGFSDGIPSALAVGANGQILIADNSCAEGLRWANKDTGTVTQVNAGTGLTGGPITSSGTLSLANTTVTPGCYQSANITVDAQGRIIAASTGTGAGVTEVCTGTGLTGGPISTTGTISLSNTAVIPGTYTYASVVVDEQGRLTSAASGPSPIPCSILSAKGSIVAASGASVPAALPVGLNGQFLSADSTCDAGLKWDTALTPSIYTAKGNILVASGGSSPVALPLGLNGYILTADSECVLGTKWAANTAIPCSALVQKGAIITAIDAGIPSSLPVGADGQVLTACSTLGSTGLVWATPSGGGGVSPSYASPYAVNGTTTNSWRSCSSGGQSFCVGLAGLTVPISTGGGNVNCGWVLCDPNNCQFYPSGSGFSVYQWSGSIGLRLCFSSNVAASYKVYTAMRIGAKTLCSSVTCIGSCASPLGGACLWLTIPLTGSACVENGSSTPWSLQVIVPTSPNTCGNLCNDNGGSPLSLNINRVG